MRRFTRKVEIKVVAAGKTLFDGTTETNQPVGIDSFIQQAADWAKRERKQERKK